GDVNRRGPFVDEGLRIAIGGGGRDRQPNDGGPAIASGAHDAGLSNASQPNIATVDSDSAGSSSSSAVVAFIDEQVRAGWLGADVEPSPQASDAEWLRRVYLDIVGHIPPLEAAEEFLSSDDPQKRSQLIDRLLDDTHYVRNMSTIWTNLLIGRSDSR